MVSLTWFSFCLNKIPQEDSLKRQTHFQNGDKFSHVAPLVLVGGVRLLFINWG